MITEQQEKNFGLDLIDKASLAATILDKAVSGANFIAGASHAVSVAQALVIPLQIVGPVATVIGFMAWIAQLERSARAAKVRGEIESLHNQFYRDFNRLEGWWERQNCPVNVYKANWYKAAPYAIAQYHKKSLEGTINNPLNIFSKPMDIFSGMSKRWNGTIGQDRKEHAEIIYTMGKLEALNVCNREFPCYFLELLVILVGGEGRPIQVLSLNRDEAIEVISETLKRK